MNDDDDDDERRWLGMTSEVDVAEREEGIGDDDDQKKERGGAHGCQQTSAITNCAPCGSNRLGLRNQPPTKALSKRPRFPPLACVASNPTRAHPRSSLRAKTRIACKGCF